METPPELAPTATLVLDHRQVNTTERLLPRPAFFSSTGWGDLHLELYQQPKFATAEHQHVLHAIALGLPTPCGGCPTGSRWLDGQRQQEDRPAGSIAIIPAGVTHRCSWDDEAQFWVLALAPDLLRQVGQGWVNPDQIELRPQFMNSPDAFIHSLFSTLRAEAAAGGLASTLLIDSLKTALAIHLLRHYCATQARLASHTGGLSAKKRNQLKEYIEAHLHQEIKLLDLAQLVHISPAHFARLFKQSEGITPHQYILQRRLQKAQLLLRHSNLSVADIALAAGFCDQSHLTRCFKRRLGVTPTQFRSA